MGNKRKEKIVGLADGTRIANIVPFTQRHRDAYLRRHKRDLEHKSWVYDADFRPTSGDLSVKLSCNYEDFERYMNEPNQEELKKLSFEVHAQLEISRVTDGFKINRLFYYATLKSEGDKTAFLMYCDGLKHFLNVKP